MRNGKTFAWAAALAAIVGVLAPRQVSAGDGGRIVLSERMQFVPPDRQAGTWMVAGGLDDAGAGTAEFAIDASGQLTGIHTLVGEKGTIVIRTRAQVNPFPPPEPPRVFVTGRWWIVSGTGTYEGLMGSGTVTATADFSTGDITIMREGHVHRDDGDDEGK